MVGRSQLAAPMRSAGVVLSQPTRSTTPSIGLPRIDSSTSMLTRLRKSIAVGRRFDSPSDMTGNSSGRPPASSTPRLHPLGDLAEMGIAGRQLGPGVADADDRAAVEEVGRHALVLHPARQARRRAARAATAGSSSRSGTAFARSSSATATRSSSRAATRSRSTATSPSWSTPLKAQLPERCVLDGEIVIARRRRARLRGAAAAPPSGRLAREAAGGADPGVDRLLRPALRGRSRSARARRSRERRARARDAARASATPPLHLTPATRDRAVADGLVPPLRGRRARRRDGQAARRRLRAEQARRCSRSSTSATATASSPASAGTRTARARRSARSCSASTTTTGSLQHVGVCASFTDAKRRELVEFLAPYRENALDGHPWQRVGRGRCEADARGQRRARRDRAAGARARTCRGSRCAPSWWSRSPTITCRARASATRRSSAAGAPTSSPRDCTYAQLEVVAAARAERRSSRRGR